MNKYPNIPNLFEKVAEHQRRMEKITQSPLVEIMKKQKRFSESLSSIGRAASEFQKQMAVVANRWKELLQERELTLEELSELLSELNYPPISTDISIDSLQDLNNQLRELENFNDQVNVLDQFIVRVFHKEYIDEKLETWNEMDCLKDRIHIMEEIVNAHKLELFSLSTLAVFPQIEGVLAETFPKLRNDKGNFTGDYQKKALEEVLDTESNKFDGVWNSYYKKNTLKGFLHLEPIDYLSRHALAHGADKDYGTVVNSTKSLMIFDYIVTKVEYYRIEIEEKEETLPE
ncbi:hypothetical protein SAMN04488072_106234 [Lentibacillus halodurans]|uniref:Uncharacterized protein n=2 Tax=Lentibacillus halodurans TaxID=237679 RepID=A0A1I0Y3M6_9BACI|nr:hypothetical protein SAMN04488072_106234 [Lentibacillus halodurans]